MQPRNRRAPDVVTQVESIPVPRVGGGGRSSDELSSRAGTTTVLARMTVRRTRLSHVDARGRARMVDVGGKAATAREAVAEARVVMRPETLRLIVAGGLPKGDVLAVARIAGIVAAKETPRLIP